VAPFGGSERIHTIQIQKMLLYIYIQTQDNKCGMQKAFEDLQNDVNREILTYL
jgi:hypothetical protein